jgi:hypothetical protein
MRRFYPILACLDEDNLVVFYYVSLISGLIREVARLEDNLVVFYYLSASDIWPDKRWRPDIRGTEIVKYY